MNRLTRKAILCKDHPTAQGAIEAANERKARKLLGLKVKGELPGKGIGTVRKRKPGRDRKKPGVKRPRASVGGVPGALGAGGAGDERFSGAPCESGVNQV